jgi:uncharacterized membrane protein
MGPELINGRTITLYYIIYKYKLRASLIIVIISILNLFLILILTPLNRRLSGCCRESAFLPSLPLRGKPS